MWGAYGARDPQHRRASGSVTMFCNVALASTFTGFRCFVQGLRPQDPKVAGSRPDALVQICSTSIALATRRLLGDH